MVVDAVRAFFERHHLDDVRVVVACSGGADSTALLLALAELRRDLVCAHVNHHLRGAESDEDERFVRSLCGQMNIPFVVCDGTIDDESIRRSGLESAARDVRIAQLQKVRGGTGYIATAHQKNDQAETIVMRLMTGTGIAGLRGIHEVRDDGFIRPLIDVTRDEIDAFLRERNITPRVDRMNSDPRFLRNRVRAALRAFDTEAIDSIASVASQAQQLWPLVETAIDAAEQKHLEVSEDAITFQSIPEDSWMRQALLQRHIRRLDPHSRDVSARDLERLARFDEKRVSVTKTLELIARYGRHVLRRLPEKTDDFELTVHSGEKVSIPQINATLAIRPATRQPGNPATFIVRNRRHGDRFHHKKLKDYLIDRKIPAEVRDSLPLLIRDGEIVWIGGIEGSDRFKVTSPDGELFEVVLEHESREEDQENQVRVQR